MTSPPTEQAPSTVRRSGRKDVVSGLVVATAGVLLLVTALNIGEPVRPAPGVGPATLPTALSVLLIVSGLGLAGLGLRHRPVMGIEAELMRSGDAAVLDELVHPVDPPVPWRRLAVVVALFIGYALVFIPLGYIVSTTLYLGVMVTVIDPARWRRNAIFAVVFAVVVYFGFTELLSVQLPTGVLG